MRPSAPLVSLGSTVGSGFGIQGLKVQRFWGLGFGVQRGGFRIQGVGFLELFGGGWVRV